MQNLLVLTDQNNSYASENIYYLFKANGLSWRIILKKEIPFRNVFDNFNPNIVTLYDENKIKDLMNNSNIVRNIKKIKATINNTKIFINIQKEFGSFDNYIWKFTNNKIIEIHLKNGKDLQSSNSLSDTICKYMKQIGFQLIGSITIYSFSQGMGMINYQWKYYKYR